IARGELRARRDDRTQRTLAVLLVLPAPVLVLTREVEDDDLARGPCRGGVGVAVAPRSGQGEQPGWQTQHQPPGSPVRRVEKRVEILGHQCPRVTPEVAPLVGVDEPARAYPRSCGQCSQLSELAGVQGAVDGQELVVLVLSHRRPPPGLHTAGPWWRSSQPASALPL